MIEYNLLFFAFIVLYLFRSGVQVFLNLLDVSHLRRHGQRVPEIFRDTINEEKLRTISHYTIDSTQFATISTLIQQALFLAILLSGFLPWLEKIVRPWGEGGILSGLAFFALLSVISNLFHIPLGLYETFVIEERYGFNTKTFKIWLSDLAKSLFLTAFLGGFLLFLLLALILHGGTYWWFWAWMGVGAFELAMLWLYPVLIAPLFNKFEPIENQSLVERIGALMEKVGLHVKGVFKMDASKRSKHTNAYFTGIGRNKRIVLFDTLLASHTEDEVLAILAHEVGHWVKKHVLKQIVVLEIISLALFYLVSRILDWPLPYHTFGFAEPVFYVGLFLISALFAPIGFFVHPVESAIMRKFEREADDFALELTGKAEPMQHALKRLATDNLANLTPHPLYAWFYYSHPPLVERIERLTPFQEKDEEVRR
jgi:STE24 endopeptidase